MSASVSYAELAGPSDRRVAAGLRLACAVLFGIYLAFAGLLLTNAKNGLDPAGTPLGYDFTAFHTAARLAAEGQAATTYDDKAMIAAQRAAFPGGIVRLPWNYPPSFLLLLLPLAALPYAWAWVAWTGATVAAHAALARAIWPLGIFWPLMLAPAAALDLLFGQNGLLSLALLGAGMALLPTRPFLAGLVLGLLSYKPHLAVLVPVALLVGREWRALAGAAASAVGLVGLSAAALGTEAWLVFLRKAADPGGVAVSSSSDWHAIPSALVMVKDFGGDDMLAVSIHAAVALFAVMALIRIWMRPSALHWRGAALAIAILLATPYTRLYDFTLLALPIAAFASAAPRPSRWEQAVQAAIWLLPLWLLNFGMIVPLGPPILVMAMCLVVRRALGRSP